MKKVLKIFIFFLFIGALAYQFRSTLGVQFLSLQNNFYALFTRAPCSEPIPYALGIFNTEFNISKSYFLGALADAEAVWEKPFGKDLFTYVPIDSASASHQGLWLRDVLKINLVYDYRQQATSKLASLGIVVKDNKASYDMLKVKFIALRTEYDTEKSAYDARVANFNQKQQTYETTVNFWNKKGGAPRPEYNKVEQDRLALEAEAKELQAWQTKINEMVSEINSMVVVLNRLVSTLNLSVNKYNTVNASRGESFEEGVYSSDGSNREIDIYEFSNREKLVRVLAHEFGHALGLEHVDDTKAIMYRLNQGNNEILTPADLEALKIKCGIK